MSLRIAFDLDGVLADLARAYAAIGERLFAREKTASRRADAPTEDGLSSTHAPTGSTESSHREESVEAVGAVNGLSPRQENAIWREIRSTPDFWMTLEPLEAGSVRRLQELATRCKWHICFLTQRPFTAGDTVQRQTQRWLVEQGFMLPTVIVHQGSRGRVAGALGFDVLVDDTVRHCTDVLAESNAQPVLILRRHEPSTMKNATKLGIRVCRTVSESFDYLEEVASKRSRPSFFRRVATKSGLR